MSNAIKTLGWTPDEARRFWSKVERVADGDSCWLWTGGLSRRGYGRWRDGANREHHAHRALYAALHGLVPEGLQVYHTCLMRNCCRPSHLEVGTSVDVRRAYLAASGGVLPKYEVLRGEDAPGAVLNEAKVLEIKRRLAAGGVNRSALAREYGVTPKSIYDIGSGKTWRHLL